MSNFRSVAVVTATLKHILQDAVNQAVSQGDVRVGAPTAKLAEENKPLVNLCLYRVVPNTAHGNDQLPTRDGTGEPRARTRLALDLHYLLSFYGNPINFEAERLFGACALALGATPGLSAAAIETASTDPANSPALDNADLAAEGRAIRIGREQPSLEDWSKLWSVFFQVPYTLSTSCIVHNVAIETQDAAGGATPVGSPPGLHGGPMGPLVIETAGPAPRQTGAVAWGGTLYLSGRGIARIGNGLWIDDAPRAIDDDWVTGGNLALPLTPILFGGDAPRIGAHRLQVVAAPPEPTTPEHLRRRSNLIAVIIAPNVTAVATGPGPGQVSVTVDPPVQDGQVATLLLNGTGASSASAAIKAEAPPAFPANNLVFDCSTLAAGMYLVRLDVDGFVSAPIVETDPSHSDYGQITGPTVTLT